MLSNVDFPPLYTASKLRSILISSFSDKHIYDIATATPFSKTVLPISKTLAPKGKPVCQLLRKPVCKSEYSPIKRHTVNHVLCKYFLSLDLISFVSPVHVVNPNAKFTPLRLRIHVVKSHFHPLLVSVLKAPGIFTGSTISPPNVCNIISGINPTHHLFEAPQYIQTVAVNNPASTC